MSNPSNLNPALSYVYTATLTNPFDPNDPANPKLTVGPNVTPQDPNSVYTALNNTYVQATFING